MTHQDVHCWTCSKDFTVHYDADADGRHNHHVADPTQTHRVIAKAVGPIRLAHANPYDELVDSGESEQPNESKIGRYCHRRGSMCYYAGCLNNRCVSADGHYAATTDINTHSDTVQPDSDAGRAVRVAHRSVRADSDTNTVTASAPAPQSTPQPQPISTIAGTSVMITPQHNYVYRLDFGRRISHLMLTERDAMELSKRLRDSIRSARKAQEH